MGDQVKIDKGTFQERLTSFLKEWKNDKQNGDQIFSGADSIAVILGKNDEAAGFVKNNAFQVSTITKTF